MYKKQKIYAEICTVTKTHGIMKVNEWNVITHSVCAEKRKNK